MHDVAPPCSDRDKGPGLWAFSAILCVVRPAGLRRCVVAMTSSTSPVCENCTPGKATDGREKALNELSCQVQCTRLSIDSLAPFGLSRTFLGRKQQTPLYRQGASYVWVCVGEFDRRHLQHTSRRIRDMYVKDEFRCGTTNIDFTI